MHSSGIRDFVAFVLCSLFFAFFSLSTSKAVRVSRLRENKPLQAGKLKAGKTVFRKLEPRRETRIRFFRLIAVLLCGFYRSRYAPQVT